MGEARKVCNQGIPPANVRAGASRGSRFAGACLLLLALLITAARVRSQPLAIEQQWSKILPGNIVYIHIRARLDNRPVHIYTTRVPLDNPNLSLRPILAREQLNQTETVISMARRTNALAAVNGSFFDRRSSAPYPIGFLMLNGRSVYFSHVNRSAFGLTRDNLPLFGYPRTRGVAYVEKSGLYFYLFAMNRARKRDEAIVYTTEFGPTTRTNTSGLEATVVNDVVTSLRDGNSPIPVNGYVLSFHGAARRYLKWFHRGDRVKLYFVIDQDWLNVHNALSGGPLLIRGGRFALDNYGNERFRRSLYTRIPITAVGNTLDGYLLFVVVDGRQPKFSVGMNYVEIAGFMASQGCINAIGMDGGGSSAMVIEGRLVNRPSDGQSRPVSNAIGVFLK